MDAKAPMPEQGFSGRLVRHLDAETRVSDWQKEYGPKAKRHMSYKDICAMYPDNQWCIMNDYTDTRSRSRSRDLPRERSAPPPSSEPSRPPKRWHEAVRQSVGDPAEEARDAVQDGLGIGDSTEDAAKKRTEEVVEEEEPERDGVDGEARERTASEGAAGRRPQPDSSGANAEGDGEGARRPLVGSRGGGASDENGGAADDSADADAADEETSAGESEGTGEGSKDAAGGAAEGLSEEGAEGQSGGSSSSQSSEVPNAKRMEDDGELPVPVDRTTTIPVYGAPSDEDEEKRGWWPFSWP